MVNSLTRSNFSADPNKSMEAIINMQRASLRKIKNWRPNDLDTTQNANEHTNENKLEENVSTKRVRDDILVGINRPAGIVRRMASSISNQLLNNSKANLNSNSADKNQCGDSSPRNRNYSSFNLKRPISSFIQSASNNQNKYKNSSSSSLTLTNSWSFTKDETENNSKQDIKPFVVSNENVASKASQVKTIQFKGDFQLKETENGIQIQVRQPHLISVTNNVNNEDAKQDLSRLSEANSFNKTSIKIYPLKLGRTTIGSSPNNDIVLTGPGIKSEHCFVENNLILLDRKSKIRSSKSNSNNSMNDSECDKKKGLLGPHSLASLFKLNKTKYSNNNDDSKLPKGNLVTLYPIARLCAIDGVLIENPYQLNSGFYFVLFFFILKLC